jgi:hypothetical protein
MPVSHKFKIGQLVDYLSRERASGVYQVTQLLPTGAIYQEILENEPTLPTVKRSSASSATELPVRQNLIRFDTHEFVLRAAVRALERCCVGDRHGVVGFEVRPLYFSEPRSPNRSSAAHPPAFEPLLSDHAGRVSLL